MVAMGSSLADRAWGRESAVYRITGVLTVISGWFLTAFVAFTVAAIVAFALMYGGMYAVIGVILLVIFLMFQFLRIHKKREKNEIGIVAVRGGTIVGQHDVIFAGADEVIEFHHTAYSKAIFGKGAVEAAKFLAGKPAGMYDMSDVIGL